VTGTLQPLARGLEGLGRVVVDDDVQGAGDIDAVRQRLAGQVAVQKGSHDPCLAQAHPDGDVLEAVRQEDRNRVAALQVYRDGPVGVAVRQRVIVRIGDAAPFEADSRVAGVLVDGALPVVADQVRRGRLDRLDLAEHRQKTAQVAPFATDPLPDAHRRPSAAHADVACKRGGEPSRTCQAALKGAGNRALWPSGHSSDHHHGKLLQVDGAVDPQHARFGGLDFQTALFCGGLSLKFGHDRVANLLFHVHRRSPAAGCDDRMVVRPPASSAGNNVIKSLKVLSVTGLLLSALPAAAQPDLRAGDRRAMVTNIEQLLAAGAAGSVARLDPRVREVMREVPRHAFVPTPLQDRAYSDGALPIGHEATISQPMIVAVMTDLLEVRPEHRVLEVGTGSGYQAAVLSRLARQVYSIEIVEPLARSADARLRQLGYPVTVRAGDGYAGWPEHAPFDRIMVTAGATHIPKPLVAQLKPGGRLLIPVGPNERRQQMTLVQKDARGKVTTRRLFPVTSFRCRRRPRLRARRRTAGGAGRCRRSSPRSGSQRRRPSEW
jgi:protein-L-isoaspartate(D-aspartate) O-methyltransferase